MKPRLLPVCLTADIEFEIRGALTEPLRCAPVGAPSVTRMVGGKSEGLGALLAPLISHSLPATFFIESLQAIHFGVEPMREIADCAAQSALIDLQLHAHPCWMYMAESKWKETVAGLHKNDSMAGRGVGGATAILNTAVDYFKQITGRSPTAFRSGSLKVDLDLLEAQAAAGLSISSCVGVAYSDPKNPKLSLWSGVARIGTVTEVPVTSYRVAFGSASRAKLLTVTGTPFSTMKRLLENAWERGAGPVVFLTHASEMAIDTTNVYSRPVYAPVAANQRSWKDLCAYLDQNRDRFQVLPLGKDVEYWQTMTPVSHDPYRGGMHDIATLGIERLRRMI